MRIKPKLLFTFSEMITAAYQEWIARKIGVRVRLLEKTGPAIVCKVAGL